MRTDLLEDKCSGIDVGAVVFLVMFCAVIILVGWMWVEDSRLNDFCALKGFEYGRSFELDFVKCCEQHVSADRKEIVNDCNYFSKSDFKRWSDRQ